MSTTTSLFTRIFSCAVCLGVVGLIAWGLTTEKPDGQWPEKTSQTQQETVNLLVSYTKEKVQEKDYKKAYQSLNFLVDNYPSSKEAIGYKTSLPALKNMSTSQILRDKWSYDLKGGGTMFINQGLIVSENHSEEEGKRIALIVQNSSSVNAPQVFIKFEDTSLFQSSTENALVIKLKQGNDETLVKLTPKANNEGVFEFSDGAFVLNKIKSRQPLLFEFSKLAEKITFETGGLDFKKLNL